MEATFELRCKCEGEELQRWGWGDSSERRVELGPLEGRTAGETCLRNE